MFVGRFSWTQYKFRGDSYILSQDEYQALRPLSASQLEEMLCGIREDRWAEFRNSQRGLLWIAGVSAVSLVLALAIPFFGIIAFVGWVCCLSLAFSAVSRSIALRRECSFYGRAHRIAAQSPTYEEFREAYLGKIASFQTLRQITYYYSVNLYEEPIREKHAAANTFIVLGWPEQWNERDELIYYPGQHHDAANSITIALYRTNSPRATLIKTSVSLKITSRSRDKQEKLLSAFNESLQREFKKFSLVLADADKMWTGSAPVPSLSPFWRKSESGSFSLDYLPASNNLQTTLSPQ
jgi:hypothetical protein